MIVLVTFNSTFYFICFLLAYGFVSFIVGLFIMLTLAEWIANRDTKRKRLAIAVPPSETRP